MNELLGKTLELPNKDQPCFLPAGTIRSLLALIIIVTSCVYLCLYKEMPKDLVAIAGSVLGFYFGSRK